VAGEIKEMKMNYTKTILVASVAAAALMSAGSAMAADPCAPTAIYDAGTNTATVDVANCHLVVKNPPVVGISVTPMGDAPSEGPPASAGIELIVRSTSTGEVGTDNGVIIDTINKNVWIAKKAIDNHEGRITTTEERLDNNDTRLNTFTPSTEAKPGTLENWGGHVDETLLNHGDRITSAETRLDGHDQALALHSQQIATLGKRVQNAFEGVAMAMSLQTPHVDIGKHFALTGGYANFEGYNAISTAATVRFDQTWQLGAGVTYGTNTNQLGVKANVTAQW
jgi:hypothetical protein